VKKLLEFIIGICVLGAGLLVLYGYLYFWFGFLPVVLNVTDAHSVLFPILYFAPFLFPMWTYLAFVFGKETLEWIKRNK
jgi:hypothetical protein